MRGVSIAAVLSLLVSCGGQLPTDQATPDGQPPTPNILWIIGEDLGPELSSYGHPGVRTPNLDRLAAEGVRFTHAFTTAPVCSPSRSAFMTGMYQTTIGAHNHRSHRDDGYTLPEGVRVLTDWLRDGGYFTGNIVHLTDSDEEKYFRGTGKTDWNFHYEGEPFDTDRWGDLGANQPFYAQINLAETHRGLEWDTAHEHIEQPADPDEVLLPPYYPDHPEARADWAQYLNAVMSLDRKVGFVLRRLEDAGLTDSTVVIFMGDHGRAMVRGKQWPYDSGLHVPLIVRWPGRRGSTCSADATAAMRRSIGFEPSATAGIGTSGTIIRTGRCSMNRYKEFTYPMIPLRRELQAEGRLTPVQARLLAPTRPEEELYDEEADPYEIDNLAEDPAYAAELERLRGTLDAWIAESNDQGRTPETPEIHEYWERQMSENYDARIEAMLEARRQRGPASSTRCWARCRVLDAADG